MAAALAWTGISTDCGSLTLCGRWGLRSTTTAFLAAGRIVYGTPWRTWAPVGRFRMSALRALAGPAALAVAGPLVNQLRD